jgi:hypothetical protein
MASEPADVVQLLQTALHIVERRTDIDQQAPAVNELKESMRRNIRELERKQNSAPVPDRRTPPPPPLWARTLRRMRMRKSALDAEA